MRFSRGMAVVSGVLFIFLALISSCSNSTDYPGQPPIIGENQRIITFQALVDEEDVIFTHAKHAEEYWDGNCLACHKSPTIRDDAIWGCDEGECHPQDENLGLCFDVDHNINDCMTAQCTKCHMDTDIVDVNPTPECVDCHIVLSTGTFLDSAVEGLNYETDSQKDKTGTSGDFQFRPGETITFSLSTTVIGSATVQGILTPVDLVPGALDETDPTVTNITRLLMSLDDDGDPDNGIRILDQVHIAVQGRNISFTADSTAFGTNPDLVGPPGGLLRELNSVFTANTPRTLVSSATAQAHLGSVLDSIFPSSTRIVGAPNTRFLLYGSHAVSGGTSYQYQWYRANNPSGVGMAPILSATAQTYQLVDPDDVGKYLSFEVVPSSGGSIGTPSRSRVLGPITDDTANAVTAYSVIDTSTKVDSYQFRLAGSSDVTFDILSMESEPGYYYHHTSYSCSDCHVMYGPADLGLPEEQTNGENNDKLISNVFLFNSVGSIIDSRACDPCALGYGCYPGCDAPGVDDTRNRYNPYLDRTGVNALPAGTYHLRIGAGTLSTGDAWSGNNTVGDTWGTIYWESSSSGSLQIPNNNNYKIIFNFQ